MASVALFTTSAYAENTLAGKYYAGVSGYWVSAPDSDAVYNFSNSSANAFRRDKDAQWDGSFGMNAFAGYKLWQGNNLRTRVEGEIGYRKLGLDKKSLLATKIEGGSAFTFMANGYIDVPLQIGITPYVGLGAGMAMVDIGGYKGKDTVFAWQGILGASYSLTEFAEVFGEYRYVAFDDIEFSSSLNEKGNFLEYASHNFGAGVRFHF